MEVLSVTCFETWHGKFTWLDVLDKNNYVWGIVLCKVNQNMAEKRKSKLWNSHFFQILSSWTASGKNYKQ